MIGRRNLTRQSRKPSSRVLALVVAGVNILVCGAVTTTLILTSGETSREPPVAASLSSKPVTETRTGIPASDPTPMTTTSTPPSSAETLAGYQQVFGPGGMMTYIPVTWQPVPTKSTGSVQANDPEGTSRFVRYGGSLQSASDAYERHAQNEQELSAKNPNFTRLHFEMTVVRGMPAIDREFQYDEAGVRRHARGVFWLARGHEYFVYVSAPDALWQHTEEIFVVMLDNATP